MSSADFEHPIEEAAAGDEGGEVEYSYLPFEFLANVKQEVEEGQEEFVQGNYDSEDQGAFNHEIEMDSSVKSEVEDIEEDNEENNDCFFESTSKSSSSSEILTDDSEVLEVIQSPTADPIPVILPPESITAILESQDIADPNPMIIGHLGNAALQQLKHIILVASQVAFHNKASGIRVPDFIFAEKHLNNTPYTIIHDGAAAAFEEPDYELSSSGLPVQAQGPIIDLEAPVKNLEGWLEGPEELKEPSHTTLSVQRITFHSYQDEEDFEDSEDSGEESVQSDGEKKERQIEAEEQEESDSSDLLVPKEDDDDTFESTSSANTDDDSGHDGIHSLTPSEYYGQMNGAEEEVQDGVALENKDTETAGQETEEAQGDEEETEETPSSPVEAPVDPIVVAIVENEMELLAGLEDALSQIPPDFDTMGDEISTTHDDTDEQGSRSTLSGSEDEGQDENLDQDQDNAMEVEADAAEENEADAIVPNDGTPENTIAHTSEVGAPVTSNEARKVLSSVAAEDNVDTEENVALQSDEETTDEVLEEEVDMEMEVESDASDVPAVENSEASYSSNNEESEEPCAEIDEEIEDDSSLAWADYMKVLTEEFMALDDEDSPSSAQQLSQLQDAREAEVSEFSLFVEDIAKHGFLPMISVWCDFCKDFLKCKLNPTVCQAHLNGMLSLFEAILKNRVSECITQKQMKQILIVLIEMVYNSPPWDIHRRLVSMIGLVLKSTKEDLLLEMISWMCSFVSETFDWFVNSAPCFDDWDQKCRIFNIALLVVNELEQQGLRFIHKFKWHKFVANVIRACDAIANLRRLAVDKLDLKDLQGIRDKKSSSTSKLDIAKSKSAKDSDKSEKADIKAEIKPVSEAIAQTQNKAAKGDDDGRPTEEIVAPQAPEEKPEPDSTSASVTVNEDPPSNDKPSQSSNVITAAEEENNSPVTDLVSDDEEEPLVLIPTSLTVQTILDSLENKALAEKLRMDLSDLETDTSNERGTSDKKLNLADFPLLGREFVHQDMENGILLFLKAFFRNYSLLVPEAEMAQAQRFATSYFGDRANQLVRSSQMLELEYPKAKRRKNGEVLSTSATRNDRKNDEERKKAVHSLEDWSGRAKMGGR